MRGSLKRPDWDKALKQLLVALERELLEATDDEVLAAAHSLGMDPKMKGSAAFAGIRHSYGIGPEEFFDIDTLRLLVEERWPKESK
jgi:hypothetical protein